MKIAVIGTGYVGLPTGIGLSELNNKVICIDQDKDKIDALTNGYIPIYEDKIDKLFKKNIKTNRLSFTTNMKLGVQDADIIIITVGTPPHPITNEADMQYIHAAAKELSQYITGYTVIAIKSTVPIGTGDDVENIIQTINPNADFDVVSLPEFLREGFAIHDFFNPDRIIVGSNSSRANEVINKLYKPFHGKTKILFTNRKSAEVIKYASNAFLAMKISYINEMANFCEKTGANVFEVAKGMGLDTRIGDKFLNPGPGFGGSCFPKDTIAMAYMGKQNETPFSLIEATITSNENRKHQMATKILNVIANIPNPKVSILGLTFKNGTDDCRQSPAVEIINLLLEKNIQITAYDPKGMDNAKLILGDKINYANSMEAATQDADILTILTEWDEFKTIDFKQVFNNMKHHNILDLRNILDKNIVENFGFKYLGIGF